MAWNGRRAYPARALTEKALVGYIKDMDLMRHGITPQKVPTVAAVTGVADIGHQTPYRFQYVSIIGSVDAVLYQSE
jgi:hypothetical protein